MITGVEKKLKNVVADIDTNSATQLLFVVGLRRLLGVDRDRAIEMAKGMIAIAVNDQRRYAEKQAVSLISEMLIPGQTTGKEAALINEYERSKHILNKTSVAGG